MHGATSESSPFCLDEGQGSGKAHLGGLCICQKMSLFDVTDLPCLSFRASAALVVRQGLVLHI